MFNLGLEKLQKDRRTDTLKVCWILFKVFSYFSHCWVLDQKGQVLHHLSLFSLCTSDQKNNPNQQAATLPQPAGPALFLYLDFLAHPLLLSSPQCITLIPHHRCTELGEQRPLLFLPLEERQERTEHTHEWLCLAKLPQCAAMGMTCTRLSYLI